MTKAELSAVPLEARPYQGSPAGLVTRLAANTVDAVAIAGTLIAAYSGFVAVLFVTGPRNFHPPDPTLGWLVVAYFAGVVVYLTGAWWLVGRTLGDHFMGLRVVTRRDGRLRPVRALARAVVCAVLPVGLLWCAVSPDRRALHDLLLRTSVVYDWLSHDHHLPTPEG
jgi:uncharacterized RDD family membrane protein YckC